MSVPGIINPFSPSPLRTTKDSRAPATTDSLQEKRWLPEWRPHPSFLPPPEPLVRKRGWQPSNPEPSPAATITASTEGYLNVHPRHTPEAREEDEGAEMTADLPPAKRRRTLAGAIVSGAVNAALIGTAVGLTVFRLWRDRGKVPELDPPPYDQGDWVPPTTEEAAPSTPIMTTPSMKRKSRSAPNTVRRPHRHRRERTQMKIPVSPPRLSRHPSPLRSIKPGSDSTGQMDQADDLEDRMDWMGGRLTQLIEDGKRALGKEVVVMSEVQDDEEDDGNGDWEEDDDDASVGDASRSGSVRRRRRHQPRGTPSSSSYLSPPPTASPHQQQFSTAHLSYSCSAIPIPGRSAPDHSADITRLSSSFHEDESHWQSPALRESMERARAAYVRNHQ